MWGAMSGPPTMVASEQAGAARSHLPLRRLHRGGSRDAGAGPRRVRLAARPLGLRQDHDAADDRRLPRPHGRHHRAGRARDLGARPFAAAREARHVDDLPVIRDLAEHDGGRERRLRPRGAPPAAPGDPRQGRPHPGRGAHAPPPRPLPGRAVGRPAAARGAGAGHRGAARRPAARRAAQQPRRQPPRGDALRDPSPARRVPHHDRLRDPRPGGGHGDLRPHRGDERRAHRTGGRATRALRAAAYALRRRLHRPHELPRGRGARRRRRLRRLRDPARALRGRRRAGRPPDVLAPAAERPPAPPAAAGLRSRGAAAGPRRAARVPRRALGLCGAPQGRGAPAARHRAAARGLRSRRERLAGARRPADGATPAARDASRAGYSPALADTTRVGDMLPGRRWSWSVRGRSLLELES